MALAAVAAPLVGPLGEPPLPTPGSARTVASLVSVSHRIQKLPANLVPNLSQAFNDDTGAYYPSTGQGCGGVHSCVFGDARSTTTIVLFGDSHAYMWLPALVPFAVKQKIRLILVWLSGCPAAAVSVWNETTHEPYTSCNSFRTRSIAAIRRLAPSLVLLASRTTQVEAPNQHVIAQSTWQHGLEVTIHALATPTTSVAVIGDITQFSVLLPDCLAAEQSNVQACSSRNPNPKIPGHFGAEERAARATRTPYLNPQRWLCTSTCSPVIGNMVAYYNDDHVSATYAAYLGTVFSTAASALLPR
jgi:hypothetical protein